TPCSTSLATQRARALIRFHSFPTRRSSDLVVEELDHPARGSLGRIDGAATALRRPAPLRAREQELHVGAGGNRVRAAALPGTVRAAVGAPVREEIGRAHV